MTKITDILGSATIVVQASGRDYRGHDADWDETLTVAYKVNPVEKTCEVLEVVDSRGSDYWCLVRDDDWQRIEEWCIEHAAGVQSQPTPGAAGTLPA